MRAESIKKYLKASKVVAKRSTFSHAFASALAPFDVYDPQKVKEALAILGQLPEENLSCCYCGRAAATWDHIRNTTQNTEYSGFGHRIGNLLPCCRNCNERKGKQDWSKFLEGLSFPLDILAVRRRRIAEYISRYGVQEVIPENSEALQRYKAIRAKVYDLLKEADILAAQIRSKDIVTIVPGGEQAAEDT